MLAGASHTQIRGLPTRGRLLGLSDMCGRPRCFSERTSVGLDVHARSVAAAAIDGVTGELVPSKLTPAYADIRSRSYSTPADDVATLTAAARREATAAHVLRLADTAMYAAKTAGSAHRELERGAARPNARLLSQLHRTIARTRTRHGRLCAAGGVRWPSSHRCCRASTAAGCARQSCGDSAMGPSVGTRASSRSCRSTVRTASTRRAVSCSSSS